MRPAKESLWIKEVTGKLLFYDGDERTNKAYFHDGKRLRFWSQNNPVKYFHRNRTHLDWVAKNLG